ncbi:hypothetical protein [Chryseobacterium sp. MP_3.2]|uniref:hypothetical protein n=1 Tax=Chryseobacterium sp. MP_3.2 TaxID=3071712 RepID=UPI002E0A5AF1|nr:hypothetical protein [Chryseobacterium sp. MP_3.2]
MKKAILSALLGLAIVISCEKKQEENLTNESTKTEQNTSEEKASEAQEKSDEHKEGAKLELNNGAKWTMNVEMKPFLNDMETQLNAYNAQSGDYNKLGNNLSATNDNLIKSCTIKGTPHDVLHSWLAPHMKEIEKLKKADNREKANKIVDELKESMVKYHEYFN